MGVNRRSFIAAGLGFGAGILFTPIPWKFTDDLSIWTQNNWPWVPQLKYGEQVRVPSISKMDGTGSPVDVLAVQGNPTVTYGNAKSPFSQGGINALAASEVKMLYSMARVAAPMKEGKQISWEDASAELISKLKAAGDKVAFVSGDSTGTANEVFSAFLAGLGSDKYFAMPGEAQVAAEAWQNQMGGEGFPGFDVDNADLVLAVGADIFESFPVAGRFTKAMSAARPIGEDAIAEYIYAGPVRNGTGSVSNQYVPVLPGGEAVFALGLAYHLLNKGYASGARGFSEFKSLVMSEYTPDKVEAATGVKAVAMSRLAARLTGASRPLVIPGSSFGQGGSPAAYVAAMAVNMLLDRMGKPGGVRAVADSPVVVEGAMDRSRIMKKDLVKYLMDIDSGKETVPQVLMVYEANPVYALPQAEVLAKVLEKIPYVVSFSSYMDETAAKAKLVLPNALAVERFESMDNPYGAAFASFAASWPIIPPVVDAIPTTEFVLGVAPNLGVDLGYEGFSDVLAAKMEVLAGLSGFFCSSTAPWEAIAGSEPETTDDLEPLAEGECWCSIEQASMSSLSLAPAALYSKAGIKADSAYPLSLAPELQLNVGSPSVATPAAALTTIRDDELKGREMFVGISQVTAHELKVAAGQKVKIAAARGEITARVRIDDTVMPGVVSAPLGFGHTAWDVYSKDKGANVSDVLSVSADPGTGTPVWVGTKVKIS